MPASGRVNGNSQYGTNTPHIIMRVILRMTVILVMVVVVVVGVMIPRYLKVVKPGQWSRNSLVNVLSIIVAPLLLLEGVQ